MRWTRTRTAAAVAAGSALLLAATACADDAPGRAAASASSGATASTGSGTSSGTASPAASTSSPTSTPTSMPTATSTPAELPRGGRELLPRYRLVGYAGGAGSAAFGRLGVGDIDARVREIERRASALAGDREPMPVLELITVVAHDVPGPNGTYATQVSDDVVRRYLAAARRHKALLLLDVQPGREDFLPVVKRLRPWLEQPDVGLALDPEWAVEPGKVPGQVFGRATGHELDTVAAYLDALVQQHDLPQKAMVFHQVAASVVVGQRGIRERPGVVVIKSVDGIGSRSMKTATWRVLVKGLPASVHTGIKLFFDEDTRHGPLMTPQQVLALRPQPEYVLYE